MIPAITILIIVLINYVIPRLAQKYLHIEKQNIMQSAGRKAMIVGNVIYAAVIIVLLMIPGMPPLYENFKFYLIIVVGLIVLLSAYQVGLEKKYFPHSRQYIVTLIVSVIGILYVCGLLVFID
ncbi:DUF4181 domain-containing protein [Paenibacillus dauci]|uniref:DUF4181 domain-containing protein n=1 Tax=Paenibacillus dauci TaxID=1567106 RepID=UPI00061984EB|nr:DUF4181 domain-containing protein [Paenibacillus dauci]